MRVGIVGAGVAGVAAARLLTSGGHSAVLFEKDSSVGGRCATQAIGPYLFDSGASGIAPAGQEIEQVMLHELPTEDLVTIEKPIYLHQALRVISGDPRRGMPRYTYRSGIRRLPELLSQGLDVRLATQIDEVQRNGARYQFGGEEFDAVVLTPPIPQTSTILWSLGESRPFANVRYRPCLSVMLGFDCPLPETRYHALLDGASGHPLTWLSLESVKSSGRAPENHSAVVAQMSPAYTLGKWSAPDEKIVRDVAYYMSEIFGEPFRTPIVSGVRRWKYSQPDSAALFATVNPPESQVVVASDGVVSGRIGGAYDAGRFAARLLMQRL